MDSEEFALQHEEIQEMMFFIKETYCGKNTQEVKRAEDRITNIIQNHPSFVIRLFDLITHTANNQTNFKQAVANVIKKQYYKIAEKPQIGKKDYVATCYQFLLTSDFENIRYKEQIGTAMEYIFNKDEQMEYKNEVASDGFAKIDSYVQQMQNWTVDTTVNIHGIVISYIAYMNSLVEPEDILAFVLKILPGICLSASICLRFAVDNLESSVPHSILFLAGKKIFQLIEMAVQRLMDEQQFLGQQINTLKNHELLQNVITDHLYSQNIDSSILCPYPDLNQIKQSAMEVLNFLNIWKAPISKGTINTLLYTFLKQSTKVCTQRRIDEDDDFKDQILCRVMEILESFLEQKKYYTLFLEYKVAILFALMMYSRTQPMEEQNLYEEPEKFSQVAEEYSECFARSPIIKVRAANFLRTYLKNIDEGVKNLIQLLTIFITSSLCADKQDSPILAEFKKDLGKFDFWGLTNRQKLQVSFMVLTVMTPLIQTKHQVLEVIYSILAVHSKLFQQIKDELVLCRLIRLIGYYPFASYFYFIQQKMSINRAFFIEGIQTFQRIIKNQQYLKTFPLMYSVFIEMIDSIDITESIFEQLLLNHYHDIVCKSEYLFKKIVQKLLVAFESCIGDNAGNQMPPLINKHKAILSFNYIDKILKKERLEKNNNLILNNFKQMERIGKHYQILDENIIGVYHTIVNKFLSIEHNAEQFAVEFSSLSRMRRSTYPTQFYLFLNKLLLKTDNFSVIQAILIQLQEYMVTAHEQNFDVRLLPHLCFVIGQIITSDQTVHISQRAVDYVLQWVLVKSNKQNQSYQSMMFLCLNYVNLKPAQVRQYLLLKDVYYSFMVRIFQTKMTTKIHRKAVIFAMKSIIAYEPQKKLSKEIIKFCITTLLAQKHKYKVNAKQVVNGRAKTNATMRRFLNFNQRDTINNESFQEQTSMVEEQRMENDEDKQNFEIFKGLKHPFDKMDQFQTFKYGLQGLDYWKQLVDEQDMENLINIFSAQWHKDKVRNILRVKRPQ